VPQRITCRSAGRGEQLLAAPALPPSRPRTASAPASGRNNERVDPKARTPQLPLQWSFTGCSRERAAAQRDFCLFPSSIAQKGALFVFDFPAPRMMGDGGMLGKAATAPNMASISVNLRIADRVIDPGNCAAKCLGRRWGGSRFYGRRFAGVARSTPRLGLLTKAGCT